MVVVLRFHDKVLMKDDARDLHRKPRESTRSHDRDASRSGKYAVRLRRLAIPVVALRVHREH